MQVDSIENSLQQFFDTMSPFLKSHCIRVEEYTDMLIDIMKRSKQFENNKNFELIYSVGGKFARWHDIGKALVSNNLWDSSKKLSEEEVALIKAHPILGAGLIGGKIDIVKKYDKCENITDLAIASCLFHHERWDSNGYPFKIGGKNIPLAARMTSLADSFDSMVDERPYKTAKTIDGALDDIKKCAGTQFDPQLADLFIIAAKKELLHTV
ncbi:MAG: HD domain-containing phosphohydrolase [Candidatus Metalachnospira sp.]|nr:HD domain-containing phosphohydrolase [Candidatus Metalachnospira sp.]